MFLKSAEAVSLHALSTNIIVQTSQHQPLPHFAEEKVHKEIHKTNPSPNVTGEEECYGQIMKEINSYIIMAEKLDGTRQLGDLGIGLQGSQTFTMDPHK